MNNSYNFKLTQQCLQRSTCAFWSKPSKAPGTNINSIIKNRLCKAFNKPLGAAAGLVALLALTQLHSLAASGDVDLSFDTGSAVNATVNAVALQSDGKVLIGGDFTTVHAAVRGHLARLNADGSTDQTFLNGLAGANAWVSSIALQSDGRILIAGGFTSVNGVDRNHVARLNVDGSLDDSFLNELDGASDPVRAVTVQSDGKVLIGGDFQSVNGVTRHYIARLNPDGSLDTSFLNGLDGADGNLLCLAVQSDGKILIGGTFSSVNGETRNRIARLNPDGTLDVSFLDQLAGANNPVYCLAQQSDGKVLIGGVFSSVNDVRSGSLAA